MTRHRLRERAKTSGVTLLELMAVVAVIGVLGIIALPSYRQYALRAQRTDAKNALLRLATNQERFYLVHRTYAGTAALSTAAFGLGSPPRSEKGAYAITIAGESAVGYTATATAVTGGAFDQTGDTECQTFSITAQGAHGATPDPNSRCW